MVDGGHGQSSENVRKRVEKAERREQEFASSRNTVANNAWDCHRIPLTVTPSRAQSMASSPHGQLGEHVRKLAVKESNLEQGLAQIQHLNTGERNASDQLRVPLHVK